MKAHMKLIICTALSDGCFFAFLNRLDIHFSIPFTGTLINIAKIAPAIIGRMSRNISLKNSKTVDK